MQTTNILVVDDTPANIDLLCSVLEKNFRSVHFNVANTGERALHILENNHIDLVLLDVMMPGLNGFETCKKIRENPRLKDIPVIFVTALGDDVSKGFQAGGDDYISKPLNNDEVIARVRHQLDKLELLQELKSLNENLEQKVRIRTTELAVANRLLREEIQERRFIQDRLQYMATHDFVTHLYNRNALEDFVTETITWVQVSRRNAVFIMMDVDRFKLINESCGCFAGDELLRQFADIVSGVKGEDDFFARIGGDKFVLVSRDSSYDKALLLVSNMNQVLKSYDFRWDDRHFHLATASAVIEIDMDIASFDQLMLIGDEMIYHLKKEKKYLMTHQQMKGTEPTRSNVNWAVKLMDSLRKDQFIVYFQKLEKITGDAPEGIKLEALVRLKDKGRIIPPDEFIPAAERYNLITDIDKWVIGRVGTFLGKSLALGMKVSSISVNLSAITIRDPELVSFIESVIRDNGFEARSLAFEITETESIVNMEAAKKTFTAIKNLGCSLVLDDFGKGFSSFNYLREISFDTVKIDGVFVKDIDKNASHLALVKSIVEVARQLNKSIVAEYVESEAIYKVLKELKVDWGQGYYFHVPEELTNLFKNSG